ncbi:MAG: type IX secretion system sortase PorU [Bacteroidia bacterium]
MKTTLSLFFSTIFVLNSAVFAQNQKSISLEWRIVEEDYPNLNIDRKLLGFEQAEYNSNKGYMPFFIERIDAPIGLKPVVKLEIEETRTVKNDEAIEKYSEYIPEDFQYNIELAFEKGKEIYFLKLTPIRKSGNQIETIERFSYVTNWELAENSNSSIAKKRSGKIESKLKSGEWHKVEVTQTGVYKIDKDFLDDNGIDIAGTDVDKIAVFGYGGKELPMLNSALRPEDMQQLPAKSFGLNDGSFDDGDYLLFYAEGPITWQLNGKRTPYKHAKHAYSENVSYMICVGGELRKEPIDQAKLNGTSDVIINNYDYLHAHHVDQLTDISKNVKTGKEWFGEEFNFNTKQTFNIGTVNGLITADSLIIKSNVFARNVTSNSTFTVRLNNKKVFDQNCSRAGSDYLAIYAHGNTSSEKVPVSTNNLVVEYEYNKPNSSAVGWLNFFEIQAKSRIVYDGNQLAFRNKDISTSSESIVEFNVESPNQNVLIWKVSDIDATESIPFDFSNNQIRFKTYSTETDEYIIFNPGNAYSPTYASKIENQNLHGLPYADVLIIAYDSFLNEAQELANFHSEREGFRVNIATPQQIYNEFSSGTQDITALRDYVRYFYETASIDDDKPKYLIMFGDASYDFKDRIVDNTNLVPSYQSENSTDPTNSYVSDDFFGLLDSTEGAWEGNSIQLLDLAIGRLPVNTRTEAKAIVAKIKAYHDERSLGDWRNNILFVADDEDSNLHLNQTEDFATLVDTSYPLFNIKKIYFDAFPQEIGPGGAEYPEVEKRLDEAVESGVLVVNYMGHGGELGWAHERVLDNSMISSWNNIYRMPLFVTATCEFSRFDDPERTSAGENVFLNGNGGAIAMLTTTRVVYAGANAALLRRLYTNNAFEPVDGQYRTLGEIIMTTKNKYSLTTNTRNFTLLGDPTIRLAYPKYRVKTLSINGNDASLEIIDTVQALSKVSITGMVTDVNGNKLTDFNGIVYPTVFDKTDTIRTLANDANSKKTKFALRKNIIYKGKATVANGDFKFEFVIPKDISYKLGNGKISYYVDNETIDGNGAYFEFFIGGTSDSAIVDEDAPDAKLFVNDLQFSFGGLSSEDPLIIGKASDDNGINTVGTGIGHELTVTLDDKEPIVVNDYYESDLDDYRSGTITYPFKDLEEGRHSITLKVWDVANNSATAYTEFVVANSAELALEHVVNYPNPFTNNTTFWVNHNRPGEVLDVSIQIFSVSGKLVKTLKTTQVSDGATFNNLNWDGRDDFGNKIGKGVYVYKVIVKTQDGLNAEAMEKLVILN